MAEATDVRPWRAVCGACGCQTVGLAPPRACWACTRPYLAAVAPVRVRAGEGVRRGGVGASGIRGADDRGVA